MAINASHCPQGTKHTCYGGSNTDVSFLLKHFFPESWKPKASHYERFLYQLTQISAYNEDWFSLIDSCTPSPVPCQTIAQSKQ